MKQSTIKKKIKRIGVLTSGGDAPGMNAAIRAVVRTGNYYHLKVFGISRGYEGMIAGDITLMPNHAVANIIQRGGTILKTARSEKFMTKKGMQTAYNSLLKHGIDGLVVIGGDGSFRGGLEFGNLFDFPVIGVPGTIDNDLYGTDFTIGYDTALNTVVEAVDKLRDTAASHNRLFFVEVMGRDAGFIALRSGIACGAEDILVPETATNIKDLIRKLESGRRKNKTSGIIIVAEGDELGGAFEVARKVKERFSEYETRVAIIGHLQRGGSPTCMDRVLASRLGYEAVLSLRKGISGVMVGQVNKEIIHVPFTNATKHNLDINQTLLEMSWILST